MVLFLFRFVLCSLFSTLLHAGVSLLGVGSLSSGQRDSSLTALPPGSFLPPNATFAFLNHTQSSPFSNDLVDNSDGNAALFTRVEGAGMVLSMDRVLMQSAGGHWIHEKEQPTSFTRGSASLRFHFLNGSDGSGNAILSITHNERRENDDRSGDDDDSVVSITAHSIGHGSGSESSSSRRYMVAVKGSMRAVDYLLTTTITSSSTSSSSVIRDLIVLNQSVAASVAAIAAATADKDKDTDDDDINHFDYHDITTTSSSQSDDSLDFPLSLHSALSVLTRAVNHSLHTSSRQYSSLSRRLTHLMSSTMEQTRNDAAANHTQLGTY